ncbi:MAG: tripartite tricarboxylate transporter substrate binding protein [Ottowia sp.]|nr:tripartite tricarboxylate transporter substrate binding protein [Rhodoferax sp.]MCB2071502.1 tripartite tricarboxylate transporter substrate binding protein [Ottowia sp.]
MTYPSNTITRRRFVGGCAASAAFAATGLARAADAYPGKPVTVIVPYAPGGQGDVFARLIGDPLGRALGQPVIVDNRPGASGALGARIAAKAPADGYTLLLGQTGEIAINGSAMKNPGYDTLKDFRAIALVGNSPLVLATPASSPYATLDQLVQAARQKPGSIAYASSGTATPGHLAGVALATGTRTEMIHVPYKGAGQAITDLIGGQVQFFFASASSIMPHVQAGKVKALAVSTPKQLPALPNVPPVADTLKGFDFSLWGGYFCPRATPDAVVGRLADAINKILGQAELRGRLEAQGTTVDIGTPQSFDAFVRAEIDKYTRLVKAAGAKLDS